jgi:DNA processing protein
MTISPACLDMIALNMVPGLGPARIKRLLARVNSPADLFSMSDAQFHRLCGGMFKEAGLIRDMKSSDRYRQELDHIEKEGIHVICSADEEYPESLRNIYDPPAVLYVLGDVARWSGEWMALVGSRLASLYGMRTAGSLARDLAARGVTIVSGLARGIDSAAHRGALEAGGRTVAVVGSGLSYLRSSASRKLAREIIKTGAIVTEFSFLTPPSKGTFPRRNRIISALAKGVVVVEAARKSGALITSDFALEHGKDVYAVPGPVDSVTSSGTNRLIQQGAKLILSADDILEDLDMLPAKELFRPERGFPAIGPARAKERGLPPEQQKVMRVLSSEDSVHIDAIAANTGMSLGDLHKALLVLELKGRVKALPGSIYSRRVMAKNEKQYSGS